MKKLLLTASIGLVAFASDAQSIMKAYGSPCVGVEMVFQFMGNCTVNYWTVNSGGTITYTSPDKKSIKVRYTIATTAFISANYMNCGSGTASYPPLAISSTVTPSITISATSPTSALRSCPINFTASIANGGTSPIVTWLRNGAAIGSGMSISYSSFNSGDVVQAQLTSNHPCMTTATVASNTISVTVTEITSHTLSGSSVCPGQVTSIYLSGSQPGVTYELVRNGSPTGLTQAGGGSFLRWDNQPAGTYTVTGRSCSTPITVGGPFTVSQINPGNVQISTSGPPVLCSGSPITLTASGGSSYVWRSGGITLSTATSFVLNPTQPTTVQLEGRESNCQTQVFSSIYIDVSASTAGGSTQAVQSGQAANTVCSGNFGLTSLVAGSYVGTIIKWEYSFNGTSYTNWGQAGQVTTTESCCMGQPGETIYVRAILKNGYCQEVPSSPTTYYWKPLPTAPAIPQTGRAETEFCQGTTEKFNSAAAEGTLTWFVTGVGNSIDQNGNVQWANDFSGLATVSVRTSNICGPSELASQPVTINASSQGGNAFSTSSQGSYLLVDSKDFGTSTVNGNRGNVLRWEYSNDQNIWINWGQEQRITTLTTCCIDKPGNSIWVRAISRNGQCPEQASYPVRYSWGDEDENFIRAYTSRIAISEKDSVYELSNQKTKVSLQSQYFDGLGRVTQAISKAASPDSQDLVEFHEYEAFGRELVKFLPYEATGSLGYIRSNPKNEQSAFYSLATGKEKVPHDLFPFAGSVVEASPLNRILKQGAPGAAWQPAAGVDHTVKTQYRFNKANEVLLWTLDAATGLVIVSSFSQLRYYSPNELRATVITDENGNEVSEFTDKLGRTILKRVQSGGSWAAKTYADTYYIYDDAGNLRVVVPPEAVANVRLITDVY